MNLKWKVTLLAVFGTLVASYGQTSYVNQLKSFYSETTTLQAHFVQVKMDPILSSEIETTGEFYYGSPGSVRWEEKAPVHKYFVLSEEGLRQWENGETTEGSSLQERILRDFILGMIDGSLLNSSQFNQTEQVEGEHTKLTLIPSDRRIARRISEVNLLFQTERKFLSELLILEKNGATTRIRFSHQQRNSTLPNGVFDL